MEKIKIPKYTLAEELINAISHGFGTAFAITALVLTVVISAKHHSAIAVVSSCIYGSSMIIMFLISCLYHSFSPKLKAKKVFRVLDHCDIYVFIAGSYTPFCLCLIGGLKGWLMFGVIWICTVIGILLNSIDMDRFEKPSFVLYLIMGWMIILSLDVLLAKLPAAALVLLISGGVVYTLGSAFYIIGAKRKYLHSVFHFFILIAAILQFFSILYVI